MCYKKLSQEEIFLEDDLQQQIEKLSTDERMAVVYTGGYIAEKHPVLEGEADDIDNNIRTNIDAVNRGGLAYLSENLLQLLVHSYDFLYYNNETSCRRRFNQSVSGYSSNVSH